MRGDERIQDGMFSSVSLEQRAPQDHPLQAIRKLTDAVLNALSPEFNTLYADSGRPLALPPPNVADAETEPTRVCISAH